MSLNHKVFVLAVLAFLTAAGCRARADGSAVQSAAASTNAQPAGGVWHVVAFRFKADDETRAKIPEIAAAFATLQEQSVAADDPYRKIIRSFSHGVNNSTEQVSFGPKGVAQDRSTEHTFILTFNSVADRDYYADHEPAHQRFKQLVGPALEGGAEGVFVTDFQQNAY